MVFSLTLWILTLVVLASSVLVVTLRNLFRAALSLGLVLLGVAGLFILLEAEFLAFVQVLIYVGAILTLVVFAIMLTARIQQPSAAPRNPLPAALVSGTLFLVLSSVARAIANGLTPAATAVTLPQLGQELVTTLVLPFEVISVVFVAVMVGALSIAASRSPSSSST